MTAIMIDTRAVLRKFTPVINPVVTAGLITPDEAQTLIDHVFQNLQLLTIVQYTKEKPEHDYFAGFDCLTTRDFNYFIDDLIDNDGEHPIDWVVTIGAFTIHCLNRYIAAEKTLTQTPDGRFVTTNREGTVDTYLIIEIPGDYKNNPHDRK